MKTTINNAFRKLIKLEEEIVLEQQRLELLLNRSNITNNELIRINQDIDRLDKKIVEKNQLTQTLRWLNNVYIDI